LIRICTCNTAVMAGLVPAISMSEAMPSHHHPMVQVEHDPEGKKAGPLPDHADIRYSSAD
jgi:hypothetical protein